MKTLRVLKLIFRFILWINPLAALTRDTIRAISSGYNEKYLSDPGHKRIKIYDRLIISMVWALALLILLETNNFDSQKLIDNLWSSLVFPNGSSLASFIFLYIVAAALYLYGLKRASLIRSINEKTGAW